MSDATKNKGPGRPKIEHKTPKNDAKTIQATDQNEILSKIISESIATTLAKLGTNAPKEQVQKTTTDARKDAVRKLNAVFDGVRHQNEAFLQKLAKAPRSDFVTVTIPRVYRKYFGSQIMLGLNNSVISIPVDGKRYQIHKHFVPILEQKLQYEDEKIGFMEQTNFEDVRYVTDKDKIA